MNGILLQVWQCIDHGADKFLIKFLGQKKLIFKKQLIHYILLNFYTKLVKFSHHLPHWHLSWIKKKLQSANYQLLDKLISKLVPSNQRCNVACYKWCFVNGFLNTHRFILSLWRRAVHKRITFKWFLKLILLTILNTSYSSAVKAFLIGQFGFRLTIPPR